MYENKIEQSGDFLRDRLDHASRDQLYAFAKANGVREITEAVYMGAYAGEKMKKILRSKGLTNIDATLKTFAPPPGSEQTAAVKTATMDDLIDAPQPVFEPRQTPALDINAMSRAEMAKECKRRGIKMQRTDSKEQLRERLSQ